MLTGQKRPWSHGAETFSMRGVLDSPLDGLVDRGSDEDGPLQSVSSRPDLA